MGVLRTADGAGLHPLRRRAQDLHPAYPIDSLRGTVVSSPYPTSAGTEAINDALLEQGNIGRQGHHDRWRSLRGTSVSDPVSVHIRHGDTIHDCHAARISPAPWERTCSNHSGSEAKVGPRGARRLDIGALLDHGFDVLDDAPLSVVVARLRAYREVGGETSRTLVRTEELRA